MYVRLGQQRRKGKRAVRKDRARANNYVSSLERMVRREQKAVEQQNARLMSCSDKPNAKPKAQSRGTHYRNFESKPVCFYLLQILDPKTRHFV